MRSRATLITLLALALMSSISATAAQARMRSVVIAFVAGPATVTDLAQVPNLEAIGLLDPTEIAYNEQQTLLDLSQGNWVPPADYSAQLTVTPQLGTSTLIRDWLAVARHAASAKSSTVPGLLAQTLGGAAYVSGPHSDPADAVLAANEQGQVATLSAGPSATLVTRTQLAAQTWGLTVVELPNLGTLHALLSDRTQGELIFAIAQPPATQVTQQLTASFLGAGVSGLGARGTMTSQSTRQAGLVTSPDIAYTTLSWLGLPIPTQMIGLQISVSGARDATRLANYYARVQLILKRRFVTIESFLLAWFGLVLIAGALRGAAGVRAGWRIGGLGALWAPCTTVIAAIVQPGQGVEIAIIVGGGFVLGAAADRLLPWPRAPLLPGAVMFILYAIDLLRGSPWIAQSLGGFDPLLGARFYGIGNEMEAALPIVLFAAIAAALPARAANRRDGIIFGAIGLLFCALVAWGRAGADVGGLFTIGGGSAAGAVLLWSEQLTRRRALAVCAVPLVGLAVLALLDLITHAGGDYTRTVLHAHSLENQFDTMRRKLDGAWHVLRRGLYPLTTMLSLAGAWYVLANRSRIVGEQTYGRAWWACLGGGYIGVVFGSVANDSGPQLLLIGSFMLACVLAYLRSPAPRAS